MRIATFAILSALVLSGCHSAAEKGLCPTAAVLAPTSALTVFRENAPADPSGVLYTVWMNNVKSGCDFDKDDKSTVSRVHLQFSAQRAPTSAEATYRVPYFVSVTHGGDRIMTKKLYLANVTFAPGAASTSFEQSVDSIEIKPERGAKIGEYQIIVGLQLTRAQLEYNTKNHNYAP
ncbi:MAG TPA: hypothetical protein VMF58_00090 [Rhizomicrobium sp.]|nr:hypothetical protein [Rhizomicrobium sp.]